METIAMKCTREEYESIKKYIGQLRHISPEDFIKFTYLCSFGYNACLMSNNLSGYVNTKYYETFDKDIFLKACGIKVKKDKKKISVKVRLKEIKNKLLLINGNNSDDVETDHVDADDLLCEALVLLGQKEIVDIFKKIGKWYS